MRHVDRNPPGHTICVWVRQCRRDLKEALPPDEVPAECRPQRITLPTGTMNLAPPFAHQGVVHHHHQRLVWAEPSDYLPAYRCEESLRIKPLPLKKPVGSRPVAELLGTGTQHATHGSPAQADQR